MAGKQFEEKEEGCGNYSHRLGMGSALASVTDCNPQPTYRYGSDEPVSVIMPRVLVLSNGYSPYTLGGRPGGRV